MNREPVAIIGLVASALVAVLEAVGGELLPEGVAPELVTIIQAAVVIAGIVLARSRVSPVNPLTRLDK